MPQESSREERARPNKPRFPSPQANSPTTPIRKRHCTHNSSYPERWRQRFGPTSGSRPRSQHSRRNLPSLLHAHLMGELFRSSGAPGATQSTIIRRPPCVDFTKFCKGRSGDCSTGYANNLQGGEPIAHDSHYSPISCVREQTKPVCAWGQTGDRTIREMLEPPRLCSLLRFTVRWKPCSPLRERKARQHKKWTHSPPSLIPHAIRTQAIHPSTPTKTAEVFAAKSSETPPHFAYSYILGLTTPAHNHHHHHHRQQRRPG